MRFDYKITSDTVCAIALLGVGVKAVERIIWQESCSLRPENAPLWIAPCAIIYLASSIYMVARGIADLPVRRWVPLLALASLGLMIPYQWNAIASCPGLLRPVLHFALHAAIVVMCLQRLIGARLADTMRD